MLSLAGAGWVSAARPGSGGGGPTAFPSRWSVTDHHFVDESATDLGIIKGFNWNCLGSGLPFAQSVFDETAALFATATVPGPGVLRHVLTWDTIEPTAGATANGLGIMFAIKPG